MTPKLSIVMSYYNRKQLLVNTLKSISASKRKDDTEIIIVDDGSDEEHRLEEVRDTFDQFRIKLIRIDPKDKWWFNPCIPYNMGFKEAEGDTVIIQNPECFHFGDILDYSSKLEDNQYFSYHAYSLNLELTEGIYNLNPAGINSIGFDFYDHPDGEVADKLDRLSPLTFRNGPSNLEGTLGYYNHRIFRPHAFHFCCAIKRKDLLDLGGFDERYAKGVAFDDNELVCRIKRKGLEIKFIPYPLVLHQHHYKKGHVALFDENWKRNHDLYNNVTVNETGWRANQNDSHTQ